MLQLIMILLKQQSAITSVDSSTSSEVDVADTLLDNSMLMQLILDLSVGKSIVAISNLDAESETHKNLTSEPSEVDLPAGFISPSELIDIDASRNGKLGGVAEVPESKRSKPRGRKLTGPRAEAFSKKFLKSHMPDSNSKILKLHDLADP